jgi:hypothetical protein
MPTPHSAQNVGAGYRLQMSEVHVQFVATVGVVGRRIRRRARDLRYRCV